MIITVAHQKGGVGKSTVAANLAVEMKFSIVDLDSQHSCYFFSLLRRREHNKELSVYTPETVDELERVLRGLNGQDLIIDSGGYDNDLNRYALLVSDLVITPVAPSQIEVFGLLKFAEIFREALKINPSLKVFVLINNADPRSSRENRELERFIESEEIFNLFKAKLYRRADYRRAYSEGLSVCEYNPGGKACREVRALVSELNALL